MDATPTPTPKSDLTSFDVALGTAAGAPTCTSCSKQITDIYHEANGAVICSACRAKLQVELDGGSGAGRFTRALGFGFLGAVIGSVIWYAFGAITGYELGLIAIVVGFLVGKGVNMGSRGRGGWKYQTLAIVLTYTAIVVANIPFILEGLAESGFDPGALADSIAVAATSAADSAVAAGDSTAILTAADSAALSQTVGTVGVIVAFILLFLLAAAAPVLAGFENIIGLLIIGFALYQAWSMNRRREITLTGPYRVGVPRGGQEAAPA